MSTPKHLTITNGVSNTSKVEESFGEEFVTELNRILNKHHVRLIAGEAEAEGMLILEKIDNPDESCKFDILHIPSSLWGESWILRRK